MNIPSYFLPLTWRVTAGALIPAFATVIFNALNFFFENYKINPMPPPHASIFDIGVGCAFSLVGICVGSKEHTLTNKFLIVFVVLLLLLLGGQVLILFANWNRLAVVIATDIICLAALTYAIYETG